MEFINCNTAIFDRSVKLLVLVIVLLLTEGRVQADSMKIVVLNSDGFEVIRALGAEDMVVGIGDVISAEPDFWGGYYNAENSENLSRMERQKNSFG